MTLSTNGKHIMYRNAARENRATAMGSLHKNLVKIGHIVLEISVRTDRHTDTRITILRNPAGGQPKAKKARHCISATTKNKTISCLWAWLDPPLATRCSKGTGAESDVYDCHVLPRDGRGL